MRGGVRRIGPAQIFRLDEDRAGRDAADRIHREAHAINLIEEHLPEFLLVARMGIPVPVKSAETRRGQRFVYRRPGIDPRIALSCFRSEDGKAGRERFRRQRGVGGACAVMDEAEDWADPKLAHAGKACVVPAPVRTGAAAADLLP